jgi:ribosomal protein S18 acetylase RimI-like enzyme
MTYLFRLALPQESAIIYALKVAAFGQRYLAYSIYQSPRSVTYLTELIAHGPKQGKDIFVAAWENERLAGYYHAVRREQDLFLSYIAVAESAQGQGLGNLLRQHFERTAINYGYRMVSLDVFESNQRAYRWYCNHGYRFSDVSYLARIMLNSAMEGNNYSAHYSPEALQKAQSEENERGFSKIHCDCGPGHFILGLIDGHCCKLIAYTDLNLSEVVAVINASWRQTRDELIISSPTEIPGCWSFKDMDKSVRLVKELK